MRPVERAGFLAHSCTPRFARRIEQAEGLIREALRQRSAWCVAFSGGKDSAVVLDLVRRQAPETPVCWLDDGWDYPETLQFLADTEQRLGIHILRVTSGVTSPFWAQVPYPGDAPHYDHPSDMGFEDWKRAFNSFLGVRAQESGARRIHLRSHSPIYYSAPWGHWSCCPLAAWSHEDVWAYIVSRGLPYNAVYDRLAELQVPLEYRRVGPLTAWMVWDKGALAVLRAGWPELYNRFVAALPDIARYT